MTLIPLDILPGAFRNGTELQARGRWRDVNCVRWRDGAMLPVGGWQAYADADTTTVFGGSCRGALAWTDNSGNKYLLIGTTTAIYVMEEDGTVTDIDPGLASGTDLSSWSMDSFGEIPVVCFDEQGTLYEWDLNTGNNLVQITNSPTNCSAVAVTDERFIFALGAGGDPRRIEWPDRDDRTVWTPAQTNQAGGWNLDTEGEIQFALQMRGEVLIVTTKDAWRARYVGYPIVWEFRRVGTCSAVGKRCGVRVDDRAYWWGEGVFYVYEGGYIREVPCEISDYLFDDMSDTNKKKIHAWHNSKFGEIEWLYEADTSEFDVDKYVSYNYAEGWWSYGEKGAECIVDRVPFTNPIGIHRTSSNLVTNGGFATDSDWTKGTNWQISGGVASQTSPTASALSQVITSLAVGQKYWVTFTVANRTTGGISVSLGADSNIESTNGTFTRLYTVASGQTLSFSGDGAWDGDIDNVLVETAAIKEHEIGNIYTDHYIDPTVPHAETGPLEIGNGERWVHVVGLIPDEQDSGELNFVFKHRPYPTDSETSETSVPAANPTDVRFGGRSFKMRITPDVDTDWRSGIHKLRIRQGGKR